MGTIGNRVGGMAVRSRRAVVVGLAIVSALLLLSLLSPVLRPARAAETVPGDGWVWGVQHTVWSQDRLSTPEKIGTSNIIDVAAGWDHSLVVKSDGTVWAWGLNEYGQLGDGTRTDRYSPVQIPSLSNVVAVAAGSSHSLALKNDGTVWAWGYNDRGQLGDGTYTDRSTPVQISGLTDVTEIEAGASHNLALKSDGTVRGWGAGVSGQVNNPNYGDYARPTPIYTEDRYPGCTPSTCSSLSGVKQVAAGALHSLALKNDGTVWAWGSNFRGELGNGTNQYQDYADGQIQQVPDLTNVIDISSGTGAYNLVAKSDGTVWAWGENNRGQLGDGTQTDRYAPVRISGLSSAERVVAGYEHSLAVKSDGTLWSWGENTGGQLGDGTYTSRISPIRVSSLAAVTDVAAGGSHSLAIGKGVNTTPPPPPPAADTTKPTVSIMAPKNRSVTRDTTPTIRAIVKDTRTNLQKSNIKLSVAGKKVTRFRYSAATDKLTYTSPRLTKGKKAVQIVATDAAGNVRAKSWYFTIR